MGVWSFEWVVISGELKVGSRQVERCYDLGTEPVKATLGELCEEPLAVGVGSYESGVESFRVGSGQIERRGKRGGVRRASDVRISCGA